jgi:hypothetical protein
MAIIAEPLDDKEQTGRRMYALARRFHRDLDTIYLQRGRKVTPLSELSLHDYFNFVRRLPYRRDVAPFEVVMRPRSIIANSMGGIDCKKKGTLLLAYLYGKYGRQYPTRLISVSTRPDGKIHHVFPQIYVSGKWRNLDATYPDYRPFQKKHVTNAEVLPR